MKMISGILPTELEACFDSLAYEEDGGLYVLSIEWISDDLHFNFAIAYGDYDNREVQNWQLQVKGIRDCKIDIEKVERYFEFFSDHVLLSDYNENSTELYFKKRAANPQLLLADIYVTHRTLFEGYKCVEEYLNGDNLQALCNVNHGLFASGPHSVLNHYFECLAKAGNEPYFCGDYPPKRWVDSMFVDEEKGLKLATLGGMYFIGKDFHFQRVTKR